MKKTNKICIFLIGGMLVFMIIIALIIGLNFMRDDVQRLSVKDESLVKTELESVLEVYTDELQPYTKTKDSFKYGKTNQYIFTDGNNEVLTTIECLSGRLDAELNDGTKIYINIVMYIDEGKPCIFEQSVGISQHYKLGTNLDSCFNDSVWINAIAKVLYKKEFDLHTSVKSDYKTILSEFIQICEFQSDAECIKWEKTFKYENPFDYNYEISIRQEDELYIWLNLETY